MKQSKILNLLYDCDKPNLVKNRHKITKADIEEYYKDEGIEKLEVNE